MSDETVPVPVAFLRNMADDMEAATGWAHHLKMLRFYLPKPLPEPFNIPNYGYEFHAVSGGHVACRQRSTSMTSFNIAAVDVDALINWLQSVKEATGD